MTDDDIKRMRELLVPKGGLVDVYRMEEAYCALPFVLTALDEARAVEQARKALEVKP